MEDLDGENEVGCDTDERECLSERNTDPHEHLETAGQFRLTGNALNGFSNNNTETDGGPDRSETVTYG